uniref:Uncharacterized protein n=1 Tax=Panagrolaimus davidi TaxID=227884 RepID=A0A914PDM9_9BILA
MDSLEETSNDFYSQKSNEEFDKWAAEQDRNSEEEAVPYLGSYVMNNVEDDTEVEVKQKEEYDFDRDLEDDEVNEKADARLMRFIESKTAKKSAKEAARAAKAAKEAAKKAEKAETKEVTPGLLLRITNGFRNIFKSGKMTEKHGKSHEFNEPEFSRADTPHDVSNLYFI